MTHKYSVRNSSLISILASLCIPAYSANHDPQELLALQRIAAEKQYARVIIDLDIDIPLSAPDKQPAALKAKLAAMEAAIFDSLGSDALKTGSWRNGLGQIGIYVTEDGLKRLVNNKNARIFGIDPTGMMRTGVYEDDGRISRIISEIGRNGYADVEVTMNLENLDFTIGRDAKIAYKSSAALRSEIQAKLPALRAALPQRGTMNSIQSKTDMQLDTPAQTVRIDMEGLLALRENENVRGLRLANDDTNITSFQIDPEVLEVARKIGHADVIIDMRRPSAYSPMKGKLPAKAWQMQAKAIRETFTDIFSSLSPTDIKLAHDFKGIASATFRLSSEALQKIAQNPDPRLQKISLVGTASTTATIPIANPTLIRDSMRYVGMHNGWAKGYTGAGQSIMIMDTGFEKSHPFINNKITYEACFGASIDTFTLYKDSQGVEQVGRLISLCPNANPVTGDSPLGLAGSAANCNPSFDPACDHGTHVAGIAAGKAGWNASLGWNSGRGLSGMAPDASIIAVKVFSDLRNSSSGAHVKLTINDDDIVSALSALLDTTPPSGAEITVNLSLGRLITPFAKCQSHKSTFNDKVSELYSLRIPVIAATGNDGKDGDITWPSCAPKVIKVAASSADQNSFPNYTNRINPALLPGAGADPATGADLIVFAPGGYSSTDNPPTGIISANLGGGAGANAGTSMAAPHVAGLYAAIKQAAPGISVANASSWVWAKAASTPLYNTNGDYSIRRITIPVDLP